MEADSSKALAKDDRKNRVAGQLFSLCQICSKTLLWENAAQFCFCDLYSHKECLRRYFQTLDPQITPKCKQCNSVYIIIYQSKRLFGLPKRNTWIIVSYILMWFCLLLVQISMLIDMIQDSIGVNSIWKSNSTKSACIFTPFFAIATLYLLQKHLIYRRYFIKEIVSAKRKKKFNIVYPNVKSNPQRVLVL